MQSGPRALGLPKSLRRPMARGSAAILPASVRDILKLDASYDLSPMDGRLLRGSALRLSACRC